MDRQQVRDWEAQCIEEQPPACIATCPMHLDVRAMIACIRSGDWAAALAVLNRSIPFPAIIGRICDRPCEAVCKRAEAGEAVRIRALERAVLEQADKRPPLTIQKSLRKKRAAIVGAGLSGLTAAVELALKGCAVVVFEGSSLALGRLHALGEDILPAAAIDADLGVLTRLRIDLRCGVRIGAAGHPSLDDLAENFDGIYLGCGDDAAAETAPGLARDAEGRLAVDPLTGATGHPKIFAGGSLRRPGAPYSPILSLQDGRFAALSLDRLFQGASLSANRELQGPFETRLHTDTSRAAPLPAVVPADPACGYTQEEAVAEAERCFPCRCMECVKVCEYLAHYKSYPKRYVREIYNNDCIVLGNHKSNRMANSCSLCGLCEEVCPENLNMGAVCLDARESMVRKGKMPPSFHDFALRDMAFSNGEPCFLARHQPGSAASAALFFPGCQLSASSPGEVEKAYAWLRRALPGGVGLMLGCCGAPAHWSGREEMFRETQEGLAAAWTRLGRPRIVAACPTCQRMLETGLPEAEVASLWEVFGTAGLPADRPAPAARRFALHDPCTSRGDRATQDGVRRLLAAAGISADELDGPDLTTCCGFGGLMSFVNPEVAAKTVDRRIAQSDADYVTYCAMCRDNFAHHGKRAVHVIDLLFGEPGADPAARPDPGFSRRQENRARLKTRLLRTLWEETVAEDDPKMRLILSPEVAAEAERRLILLDDVRQVIAHAERTNRKIIDCENRRIIASHRPVGVTYWVEYAKTDGAFTVYRVYSHRMQISGETSA